MVTIQQVARTAGVAPSTVSYVLSGKRQISASTRERVLRAVESLGYHANAGARALASRHTDALGLMAPRCDDLTASVIAKFVNVILEAARGSGRDVLLLNPDEGPAGLRRVAGAELVAGLIVMDVEAVDPRVEVLAGLPVPSVLIGLPDDPQGLACVDLDFAAAAGLCVRHLAHHGHRVLALLASPTLTGGGGKSYATRARSGFSAAAADAGVRAVAYACEPATEQVEAWLDRVAAEAPGTTGIVVQNEAALPILLALLRRRGLRVPVDVSVVAICPPDIADQPEIRLTSVDVPAKDLGAAAVEMISQLLDGTRGPHTRLVLPLLTERDSCAAPRGRGLG